MNARMLVARGAVLFAVLVSLVIPLAVGGLFVAPPVTAEEAEPSPTATAVASPEPSAAPTIEAPTVEPAPTAQAAPTGFREPVGMVEADLLNLREGPGTRFALLGQYPKGSQVTILSRAGEWLEVLTGDGKTGWMLAEFLRFDAEKVAALPTAEVTPQVLGVLTGTLTMPAAHVYRWPDESYIKQGTVYAGEPLDLLATWNGWYSVRNPAGVEGWLPTWQIATDDATASRVPVSRRIGDDVVAMAWDYIGYPYIWGASSPWYGFDCSGFTKYIYGQFGINLPHYAAWQFNAAYGTPIYTIEELQPGDIVFFANTYMWGISHVGIYAGDGQVIQAIAPGVGVGVSNIYESYWYWRYAGAIRP